MMKIRFFVVLILSFVFTTEILGQHAVEALGRPTPVSIKLRWAPSSAIFWTYANDYGYSIERETVVVNGKLVEKGERKTLNRVPIMPAEQSEWELHMDEDEFVGVAAQVIFGESLEVTEQFSSEISRVVNKSKELENRFSFGLFAADNSVKAAELSGLYFEDFEISADIEYLYRIYANVPPEILASDTGYVYMGLNDYKELPAVPDVLVEFEDKMSLISWNTELFSNIYNAFWVERSDDGGQTFHKITERPIVNTFQENNAQTSRGMRLDSLPSNITEYHYRVLGINSFGETSPPSDTVSGHGLPFFRHSAAIVSDTVDRNGSVVLKFDFPEEGIDLLKSFDLVRQDQQTKITYDIINGISAMERQVIDENPSSSNYYMIRSNDIYGRRTLSFPYLVQAEDSIPPLAPAQLKGAIDTLGFVYLSWNENVESDLYGYKLYRSNFENGDFIQVPGPIIKSNTYVDTITLETLTENIYYRAKALDNRFNPSDDSETLALKKPDKIPPVSPVFKNIKSDSLGVRLDWVASTSDDVQTHLLYRRSVVENSWSLLEVFDDINPDFYYDKKVEHRMTYAYTIIAVDDDRLESTPALPITMKWISPNPFPAIENLFFDYNTEDRAVQLKWTYDQQHVEKFLIYKSIDGAPLSLLSSVGGNMGAFSEKLSKMEGSVTYQIMVSFDSGEKSELSDPVTIKM